MACCNCGTMRPPKNLLATFSFGLESNAKKMARDLQALSDLPAAADQGEALNQFERRLSLSQIQAAKMVTTLDASLIGELRAQGIGDGAKALATLLGLLITRLLARSIIGPLQQMRTSVEQVAQTGRLAPLPPLPGRNELTDMHASCNGLMDSVHAALDEVRHASQAMAEGNLTRQMQGSFHGDLAELANAFNSSLQNVRQTLDDLQQAAEALADGRLEHQNVLDGYQGQYRSVVMRIDQAMSGQRQAIEAVRQVTHAMRDGDFSQRIMLDMPGDLHNLKRHLNEALDRLEKAIHHKTLALHHFSQGDFTYAIPGEYAGKLLDLKNNMGRMAKSISGMLIEVQSATSHAVHGIREISAGNQDLNQRVQKQAHAVQTTTQHMQLMSDAVGDTLTQAGEVARNTQAIRDQSRSGVDIVNRMLDAMTQVQQASDQVAGIASVINSISFQTNLQRIAEGMQLSQATHDVFSHNAQAIEQIFAMTESMHQALNRQSAGIHEVSHALQDIDATTQQNAAMVEQIASTSDNIISEVLMLEQRMEQFRVLEQEAACGILLDEAANQSRLTLPHPVCSVSGQHETL